MEGGGAGVQIIHPLFIQQIVTERPPSEGLWSTFRSLSTPKGFETEGRKEGRARLTGSTIQHPCM